MIDWALGLIGGLLYPLFSVIFICIDGLQGLFYAMAGIGNIRFGSGWVGKPITGENTGAENDTGLIYYLFQNSLIKNMLLSIMLLALFLIIVFTVMAFIKNAYAAKQKSWKEIVGNSIKGLANFILLPVLCLLGVWLANILLQAINGATAGGGTTQMSRKLFVAAAYEANSCRDMSNSEAEEFFFNRLDDFKRTGANNLDGSEYNWDFQHGGTAEYYANCIDQIYANTNISIYDWGTVEVGYSLWQVNYLVLVVGGIFMLLALGSLAFGMIRRVFLLIILFIVSPGVCALYPLDEGKAVQSWSGEVKKNILSAHGSVAAMNIFFALLPLIEKIHFGNAFSAGASGFAGIDNLLQLFILTSGLMCVKEFTGLLSGFIGGEDAYGKSSGQLKSAASSIGRSVVGAAVVGGFVKTHAPGIAKRTWGVTKTGAQVVGKGAKAVGTGIGSVAHDLKDKYLAKKYDPNTERGQRNIEKRKQREYDKKQTDLTDAFYSSSGDMEWDEKEGIYKKKEALKPKESRAEKKRREKEEFYNTPEGQKQLEKDTEKANERYESFLQKQQKKQDRKQYLKEKKDVVKDSAKKSGLGESASAFVEEAKGLGGELKSTAAGIIEETGAKDKFKKVTDAFAGEEDKRYRREKNKKDGPGGYDKALDTLTTLMDINEDVGIRSMSSEVVNALGDAFGEAVSKRLFKGKLTGDDGSNFDVRDLGLNKLSKTQDLESMDQVLRTLQSYADRINSARDKGDVEAEKLIIESAVDYASSTDAGSNQKLREALDSALQSFAKAQADQTSRVELDKESVKDLMSASQEAARAMTKAMKEFKKELIDEILKKKKNDK